VLTNLGQLKVQIHSFVKYKLGPRQKESAQRPQAQGLEGVQTSNSEDGFQDFRIFVAMCKKIEVV
jgi:hypothetical protein